MQNMLQCMSMKEMTRSKAALGSARLATSGASRNGADPSGAHVPYTYQPFSTREQRRRTQPGRRRVIIAATNASLRPVRPAASVALGTPGAATATATAGTPGAHASTPTPAPSTRRRTAAARKAASLARKAAALALSVACAASMGGCKYSDVLTEKIVDLQTPYEVDASLPPVPVPDPNAPSEADDTPQETEYNVSYADLDPTYTDSNPTTTAPANKTTHAHDSQRPSSDDNTNKGDNDTRNPNADSDGDSDGEGGQQGADEGTYDNPIDGDGSTKLEDPDADDTGNAGEGANTNPDKVGVLAGDQNDYSQLPYVKKVAASSQYATLVQSLCGAGGLGAANAQWLSHMSGAGAYPGELDGVVAIDAWGDGTSMNQATVDAIIDSGVDAVLTSNAIGGVTQDYSDQIRRAGISVVVMPEIGAFDSQDDDICFAVEIVGEMFKGAQKGGAIQYDAPTRASEWKRFHDDVLAGTVNASGNGQLATSLWWGATKNYIYNI